MPHKISREEDSASLHIGSGENSPTGAAHCSGSVVADAVASGSRLDDTHRAAVAGVSAGVVLHGEHRCGD
jgi:hypothetical protein